MIRNRMIAIIAALFLISGCATIVCGTTQKVTFDSEPSGAKVVIGKKKKIDGQMTMVDSYDAGVTPLTVELPRRTSTMVQISMEGYEDKVVELQRTMNPWVWGDVALTSLLSTSIDTSTGACNEYKPGQYMVTLQPKEL